MLDMAPSKQAAAWLGSFALALETGDVAAASNLFVDDCYWRDLLTFTWNVTTMEGREAIADMLRATLPTTKPTAWRLTGEATLDEGTIEAWFSFETAAATGQGVMRLRDGRCQTLFTAMTELKGFEERKGPARPLGVRAVDRLSLALPVGAGGTTHVRTLVPLQAEPAQVGEDRFLRTRHVALHVGILDAEHELPAEVARQEPVEDGRAGTADVEVPGGAGCEAGAEHPSA